VERAAWSKAGAAPPGCRLEGRMVTGIAEVFVYMNLEVFFLVKNHECTAEGIISVCA
jgi:hypothetical protein